MFGVFAMSDGPVLIVVRTYVDFAFSAVYIYMYIYPSLSIYTIIRICDIRSSQKIKTSARSAFTNTPSRKLILHLTIWSSFLTGIFQTSQERCFWLQGVKS